jgi:hypothetical protein
MMLVVDPNLEGILHSFPGDYSFHSYEEGNHCRHAKGVNVPYTFALI